MTKAIIKALLRVLRPLLNPPTPVSTQRWVGEVGARTTRRARGVEIEPVELGGIAGEVCRPSSGGDPRPAVLYLHGGYYVMGSPRTHRAITTHLAKAAGADVYALEYRLAPEHPFPAAIDDAFAAYRALLETIEPSRLAIAGDSAGGGLTVTTTLAIADMEVAKPAALALICPWTDLTNSAESIRTNARREPLLHPRKGPWAASLYAGKTAPHDPRISPLFADLTGLPPTLIQVAEDDILRDDGVRLAARAEAAGVEVKLEHFGELWHDFHLHAGILGDSNEGIARIASFLESAWAREGAE